ncbi:uncharacterized protein B0T15DRAFT_392092 [Chaetomium strumarium]|uniref:Uncharacterized protein n=1 Tax=Chaetomium strumarium TaxID=1170767 RepID=A0AAJ0GZU3_9PEZI|nr:hypothetical protein B0T15DRAFT_392092 [Chaetomium strumarium]
MEAASIGNVSSPDHESAPASPASSASSLTALPGHAKRRRGRDATVYDAVAGRVTLNLSLGDLETPSGRSKRRLSSTADRYSARNLKLAPEEALFRRKNAPVRYAEQDIYWANEDLPNGGLGHLPDGLLLKSVHSYASRFYEAAATRLGSRCYVGTRTIDERSMDETALLAFGVLLEEASREALGKAGDLVFTEPSSEPEAATRVVQEGMSKPASEGAGETRESVTGQSRPKAKRRKVGKQEEFSC